MGRYFASINSQKVADLDRIFFEHPDTYSDFSYRYCFRNFTLSAGQKWTFSVEMTQYLPIIGGSSTNFAPMMGAFFTIHREGFCITARA